MKTFLALILSINFSLSYAATIAILDSGVDFEHTNLAHQMWNNPGEIPNNRRDDDDNLYRDDFYGWNFATNDSFIINPKYFGTFSKDPHRVVNMQSALLKNGFSAKAMSCFCLKEEKPICKKINYDKIYQETDIKEKDFSWLCEKRGDKEFSAELGRFGNFAHGTHVANIASRLSPDSKIMGLKLLPTERGEVLGDFKFLKKKSKNGFASEDPTTRERILEGLIGALAGVQVDSLSGAFEYIKDSNVSVVNGSFGTPFYAIKMFTDIAYRIIYFKKPNKEQSDKWAKFFFKVHVERLTEVIKQNPKTIFVFAAGNDGTDNDVYPTSPTNVILPNVISVAASLDRVSLAEFSNYGIKNVDIAAPGVAIDSAIPSVTHDETLAFSGTSQASPFVAGVVAHLKEILPELTALEVREILLSTVDKKKFLKGKVKSGGIINENRALRVAKMMKEGMSINKAITYVNKNISSIMPQVHIPKDRSDLTAAFMPDLTKNPKTRKLMFELLRKAQAQLF